MNETSLSGIFPTVKYVALCFPFEDSFCSNNFIYRPAVHRLCSALASSRPEPFQLSDKLFRQIAYKYRSILMKYPGKASAV